MIIGFNLLLFDRDFLGIRLHFHGIDKLENIFKNFKKIFWKNVQGSLAPSNTYTISKMSKQIIGYGKARKGFQKLHAC
jgi:hypothetical protein